MGFRGTSLAICLAFGTIVGSAAEAATPARKPGYTSAATPAKAHATALKRRGPVKYGRRIGGSTYGGNTYAGSISCVPYARMVTGMAVSGNGGQWWYNAAGQYARDSRPIPGSILAFRSSGGMGRGHVAVVSRVVAPRHVQIDHANWGGPGIRRGSVMQNVNVIDVSEANNWTAVRVQVGYDAGAFGRTYPTFGFIHNRPEGPLLRADTNIRPLTEIAEMPSARR